MCTACPWSPPRTSSVSNATEMDRLLTAETSAASTLIDITASSVKPRESVNSVIKKCTTLGSAGRSVSDRRIFRSVSIVPRVRTHAVFRYRTTGTYVVPKVVSSLRYVTRPKSNHPVPARSIYKKRPVNECADDNDELDTLRDLFPEVFPNRFEHFLRNTEKQKQNRVVRV